MLISNTDGVHTHTETHTHTHLGVSFCLSLTSQSVVCIDSSIYSLIYLVFFFIIIIIDRFYIAIFSAREQTHCARMLFYMSE